MSVYNQLLCWRFLIILSELDIQQEATHKDTLEGANSIIGPVSAFSLLVQWLRLALSNGPSWYMLPTLFTWIPTYPVSNLLSALEYYTMDEVQNFSNPEYCSLSVDPILIVECKYSSNMNYRLRTPITYELRISFSFSSWEIFNPQHRLVFQWGGE
jgi:hypothetical protein